MALVIACGFTPKDIFTGLFGKAEDPSSGGRQMPAHWGSARHNIITGSSPIATQILHAAGIAYSKKYKGEDAIVGTWFGEGGTSEGDWHGAMNFAGIHNLPLVFICENNMYAISVHESKQVAGRVYKRAEGYGMPGAEGDGNDVLDSYRLTKEATERARAGEGPSLIELRTYRFYSHTSDDDDRTYRSREEVEEWRKKDPIPRFEEYLRSVDVIDDLDPNFNRAAERFGTPNDDIAMAIWGASKGLHMQFNEYEETFGTDLTREDFRALVEGAGRIESGVFPPVEYREDDHFGGQAVHVLEANCGRGIYEDGGTFVDSF
jgi:2-oxoisovalerate dehydrogenase E1 component alpha subunit